MIELDDLSRKQNLPKADNADDVSGGDGEGSDDSEIRYAIPAVVLLILSSLFICFPGFAIYLAHNGEPTVTPLERFLLIHLGIYLFVVGLSLLLKVFILSTTTWPSH